MCHEAWLEARRCCGEDEGRSLGAVFQEMASNRPLLLRLRGVVVSEWEKARLTRQVCIKEMSVSEPPMTYRENHKCCQNWGSPVAPEEVCEVPDDCAGGNRYIGGMTLTQASPWNVGTCYPDVKGTYQVGQSMRANTEAGCRGGAVRSSVEASVMGVERRDGVIQLMESINLVGGMS